MSSTVAAGSLVIEPKGRMSASRRVAPRPGMASRALRVVDFFVSDVHLQRCGRDGAVDVVDDGSDFTALGLTGNVSQ